MNILKSNLNFSKWLLIGLACLFLLEFVLLFSNIITLNIYEGIAQGQYYPEEVLSADDLRNNVLIFLYALNFFSIIIVFLLWFNRAYKNLRALGIRMNHSNAHTIFVWFVPILNLFRPYKMMDELFFKTKSVLRVHKIRFYDSESTEKWIFAAWWGLWILSNVLGRYITKYGNRLNDYSEIEDYSKLYELNIANNLISMFLTACFFKLIYNYVGYEKIVFGASKQIQQEREEYAA